jgi:hypothetical protein
MKPGKFGTGPNGKPAIEWWRHGVAAKGEPSVVTEVREYADEQAQLEAFSSAAPEQAADCKPCQQERKMMSRTKNWGYFRVAQRGVRKEDQNFIRVKASSIDAEWRDMCSDQIRTYPFEMFDRAARKVSNYRAVLLHRLRRVPEDECHQIEADWERSLNFEGSIDGHDAQLERPLA